MNISLTPELEKLVQSKVDSGLYTSASEVIRESLRLLSTYDELQKVRIKQLNQAIDEGFTQLEKGKSVKAADAYERLQKRISKKTKKGRT